MNTKRILVALTLALSVSVLCTWLVSRRLAKPPAVQVPPDSRYAAPSRAVDAGEVLRPGDLELVTWPRSVPIEGAFPQTGETVGRETLYPLSKGQPILERDLSAAGAGTGLASKIPDGMRAVALRSDEVVGVAGFLVPNSHVDVLVTYHSDPSSDPMTATVLQDAIVLAAGHQLEPNPDGKTADVTVVTLLLTPVQAERAVLASTQGAIHFVLRNGKDTSRSEDTPMLLSQLSGHAPAMARTATRATSPATVAASPEPKRQGIEIVLGGDAGGGSGDVRPSGRQDGGARP